jgi:hypothetical protein
VITLSTANSYSYNKTRTTLREYLTSMMEPQDDRDGAHTYYHFGDHSAAFEPLLRGYVVPRVWGTNRSVPSLSWGLAGDVSGVPFHVHGPVFAEVLHGRKHWLVLPPQVRPEFDPDEPPLRWLLRRVQGAGLSASSESGLLQCTLLPGEILYLPGMWWHATLNLGQTVFISSFV